MYHVLNNNLMALEKANVCVCHEMKQMSHMQTHAQIIPTSQFYVLKFTKGHVYFMHTHDSFTSDNLTLTVMNFLKTSS